MRTILTLVLSLLFVHSYAQVDSARVTVAPHTSKASMASAPPVLPDTAKQEVFRKNSIKVNLSSFALYNNSLSYERSLGRKTTFVAGYRYMPMTTVTSSFLAKRAINRLAEEGDAQTDQLNAAMTGNNTFTGEIRFYAGKKPGSRGFYLSLYGRYMQLSAAFQDEYETDSRIYTVPFDGTLKGLAGGLMIGSQWQIGKSVMLDWYILGAHYGKLQVNMPAVTDLSSMTMEEKRGLKADLETVNDEFGGRIDVEATVTDKGVEVKGRAPFAGVRGLGLSLGIAF